MSRNQGAQQVKDPSWIWAETQQQLSRISLFLSPSQPRPLPCSHSLAREATMTPYFYHIKCELWLQTSAYLAGSFSSLPAPAVSALLALGHQSPEISPQNPTLLLLGQLAPTSSEQPLLCSPGILTSFSANCCHSWRKR